MGRDLGGSEACLMSARDSTMENKAEEIVSRFYNSFEWETVNDVAEAEAG